jgi:hypothetical protein
MDVVENEDIQIWEVNKARCRNFVVEVRRYQTSTSQTKFTNTFGKRDWVTTTQAIAS